MGAHRYRRGQRAAGSGQRAGNSALLENRKEKLLAYRDVETIVLGDSSAGHMVDEEILARVTGTRTANLTLSGGFGYAGSFNMLRKALARFAPRNVLIVHTPDMPLRSPSYLGYYRSRPDADDGGFGMWRRLGLEWQAAMNFTNLRGAVRYVLAGGGAGSGAEDIIVNDYVRQGPPVGAEAILRMAQSTDWKSAVPDRRNLVFLDELAQLCARRGLNCIYVHSVLPAEVCPAFEGFGPRSRAAIADLGLVAVPEGPICAETAHLGDSYDHIAPPFKAEYAERFAAQVAPYLR